MKICFYFSKYAALVIMHFTANVKRKDIEKTFVTDIIDSELSTANERRHSDFIIQRSHLHKATTVYTVIMFKGN